MRFVINRQSSREVTYKKRNMEDLFINGGQKGRRTTDGCMNNGKDTQVGTTEREAGMRHHGNNTQRLCKEHRAPGPQPPPVLPEPSAARCENHGTSFP